MHEKGHTSAGRIVVVVSRTSVAISGRVKSRFTLALSISIADSIVVASSRCIAVYDDKLVS